MKAKAQLAFGIIFGVASACWFWMPLSTVLEICKWFQQRMSLRIFEGSFLGLMAAWSIFWFIEANRSKKKLGAGTAGGEKE